MLRVSYLQCYHCYHAEERVPAGIHDLEPMLYCNHALESGKRMPMPVSAQAVSVASGAKTPLALVTSCIYSELG